MTTPRYVMAIDQGTTSTRAILFDHSGAIVSTGQREHEQIFPRAGWVEHDPVEIWTNTREVIGEALARAGADVTGLDAAAETLGAARAHAAKAGLAIAYREGTPEALLAAREPPFDAVLALEVIEHVADRAAFCRHLAALVRPGGKAFLSTLNRTARSLLVAKIGAEYVLRLLPAGTHDWRMFVWPSELGGDLRGAGLRVEDVAGLSFDPLSGRWRPSRDLGVNYIAMAARG